MRVLLSGHTIYIVWKSSSAPKGRPTTCVYLYDVPSARLELRRSQEGGDIVISWVKTTPTLHNKFWRGLESQSRPKRLQNKHFEGYQHFSLRFEIKESWKPLFCNLLKLDILLFMFHCFTGPNLVVVWDLKWGNSTWKTTLLRTIICKREKIISSIREGS